VIALDLFGDLDTRRASDRWMPIGDPASLGVDPAALAGALASAAAEPGVAGWVAGSGFEAAPDLLDAAPPGLPRLGMATARVRALRDPRQFFAALDRLGLTHPPVRFEPPAGATGWLAKRAGGTGGWHIRPAGDPLPPQDDAYYQRRQAGRPMSALFLADGRAARLVALNELLVGPLGQHPLVYRGAVGPLRDETLGAAIEAALARLVPALAIRGLASLDFIATPSGTASLLEINPRPSASMVLHAGAWPGGLIRAHVEAVAGRLPAAPAGAADGVRGSQIVFAGQASCIDADLAAHFERWPHCRDLPAGPALVAAGDPVCSVFAQAKSVDEVRRLLGERSAAVESRLVASGARATPALAAA
jgi:predicted ATP-grasp superfamily ATP-dependent carboligase